MAKPAPAVNKQSTALGVTVRKVIVEQVVPERGVAIVRDAMQYLTEIPYKVQQGRARMPRVGDLWYVDRSMGPWVFSAYIAKDDADMATFTEKQTFSDGVAIPTNKQVNVGESASDASFASVRANDTQAAISIRKAGDTVDRVYWRTDGMLWLGPGGSTAPDVNLYRSAVSTLKTDYSLVVGADLTIGSDVVNTAWTTYTPSWTGSTGSPSLGNGTVSAAYKRIGKTVLFRIHYSFGSTTNFGSGAWAFGLPVSSINYCAVTAVCIQAVGSNRWPAAGWTSGSVISRIIAGSGGNVGIGSTVPFAWDGGDELVISGCYEAT